jgi:hypothetical protein
MTKLFAVLLSCALFLNITSAQAAEAIGKIVSYKGTVTHQSNETDAPLKKNSDIFTGDIITLGENSRAKVVFNDETTLTLAENTILEIDEYSYTIDDVENNSAEFSITQGAFKYVSGLIAKTKEPDVKLNLDFGSIGIRGTKIWRDLKEDEEGQMMCRIYVEDGKADVFNENGRVTLGHMDGTKIKGLSAAPTEPKQWGEAAIEEIKSKTQ